MRLKILKKSVLALAMTMIFSACAKQDPDLWIFAVLAPDDNCEIKVPSGDDFEFFSSGLLDVSFGGRYVASFAIENTLVASESVGFASGGGGGLEGTDWEANRLMLKNAAIRFDAPDALDAVFQSYDSIISIGIAPGGTIAMGIELIPTRYTEQLQNNIAVGQSVSVIAEIEITGEKISETDVGSNIFRFPITICNQCLWGVMFDDSYEAIPACRGGQDQLSCVMNPACPEGSFGVLGLDGETQYVPTTESGLYFTCPGQSYSFSSCVMPEVEETVENGG